MSWILTERWLWIIILSLLLILLMPLVIVYAISRLPSELKLIVTILLPIGWGIAAGYKDWVISRHERQT